MTYIAVIIALAASFSFIFWLTIRQINRAAGETGRFMTTLVAQVMDSVRGPSQPDQLTLPPEVESFMKQEFYGEVDQPGWDPLDDEPEVEPVFLFDQGSAVGPGDV